MKLNRCIRILLAAVLVSVAVPGFSQEGGSSPILIQIFPQRQKERRQSRWTLGEWMKTRGEIDRQNMWLWSHTNKVPIDFTLGWDMSSVRQGFEADIYLLRLGFRLRYEEPVKWFASTASTDLDSQEIEMDLQWRLMGGNIQDTNLILRMSYGYSDLVLPNDQNGYFTGFGFGPELQIYFAQWLGIRGEYKKLLKQETRIQDLAFNGRSYSYVGFIESGSLRGEFGYRSKKIEFSKGFTGIETEEGLFGRLRLFF
jgi:hypothetical protein